METFNYARVYTGNYSYGYIAFMPQDDTYHTAKCGYDVLEGEVTIQKLKSIKIRGAQDSEGLDRYHILKAFLIYPLSNVAIIATFTHKGKYIFSLVKPQNNTRRTMFKMKL